MNRSTNGNELDARDSYPKGRAGESVGALAMHRHVENLMEVKKRADARLGLRAEECACYSVARAVTAHLSQQAGRREDTFETEVSSELSRHQPDYNGGLVIPWWALIRSLNVSNPAQGGYLVDTKSNIDSMVLALRGRSVVASLPIESLPGCSTTFAIPVETSGPSTATLANESSEGSASNVQLGYVAMAPKTISSIVKLSRQFLVATGAAGEAYARRSMLAAVAARLDELAIAGTGTEGEPLGLIPQIALSAAGTGFDEAAARGFQTSIGSALGPDCAWVAHLDTASLLNGRQRFADCDRVLWEGNVHEGELGGWPAYSAPSVSAGHLLFGAWSNFVLAEWGVGLEILANPYTQADWARGAISLRAMTSFDVGLKRPAAFKKATAVS